MENKVIYLVRDCEWDEDHYFANRQNAYEEALDLLASRVEEFNEDLDDEDEIVNDNDIKDYINGALDGNEDTYYQSEWLNVYVARIELED